MSYLPLKKEDLQKYHDDKETVRKTALQIIKDFASFGFTIEFPGDLRMAYNDLFDQLSPMIADMINSNISKLYSLLYCIDLNEKGIKKGIAEMKDLELHDVITHLILERELKKVLTREYFSKNL
jgi:hypothetical protein